MPGLDALHETHRGIVDVRYHDQTLPSSARRAGELRIPLIPTRPVATSRPSISRLATRWCLRRPTNTSRRPPSARRADGVPLGRWLSSGTGLVRGAATPGASCWLHGQSAGLPVVLPTGLNACAERWVPPVKCERLDRPVFCGEPHLRRALAEHVTHSRDGRPHQGLDNEHLRGPRGAIRVCRGVPPAASSGMVLPVRARRPRRLGPWSARSLACSRASRRTRRRWPSTSRGASVRASRRAATPRNSRSLAAASSSDSGKAAWRRSISRNRPRPGRTASRSRSSSPAWTAPRSWPGSSASATHWRFAIASSCSRKRAAACSTPVRRASCTAISGRPTCSSARATVSDSSRPSTSASRGQRCRLPAARRPRLDRAARDGVRARAPLRLRARRPAAKKLAPSVVGWSHVVVRGNAANRRIRERLASPPGGCRPAHGHGLHTGSGCEPGFHRNLLPA